jgi:hypothetical protein
MWRELARGILSGSCAMQGICAIRRESFFQHRALASQRRQLFVQVVRQMLARFQGLISQNGTSGVFAGRKDFATGLARLKP